jgi:hypothetical protein
MSKSKIDKRQFHKKQRMNNNSLRHLHFSDSEDWEDELLDIYEETSNNYTTMRSNGESTRREQDS